MLGSLVVYLGLLVALAGAALVVKPISRLRVETRKRALAIAGGGTLVAVVGLLLPATERRITEPRTRLDEFTPAWQFHERHEIRVAAPPERVFDAIRRVRADEVFLFRTLTWIRRGGKDLPPGILNAGERESLIDVAIEGGFVLLADDPPREIVIGTVVMAPPGHPGQCTAEDFRRTLPPGFALATMNFVVTRHGPGRSVVTTETRVFATGASARRRFAGYWRVIYPGSALIRRMWLSAIERRAEGEAGGA